MTLTEEVNITLELFNEQDLKLKLWDNNCKKRQKQT